MIDNIHPRDVWEALKRDAAAQLVDVRTDAEWTYVGLPDLSALGKQPAQIAWQLFPGMKVNPDFVAQLRAAGCSTDSDIFFICRSGVRSLAAAQAAEAAGFAHCHNVADGFEGPADAQGHRGTTAGWKAEGLPWRQR
jgi:rhodanese-related sulfurtransferase